MNEASESIGWVIKMGKVPIDGGITAIQMFFHNYVKQWISGADPRLGKGMKGKLLTLYSVFTLS